MFDVFNIFVISVDEPEWRCNHIVCNKITCIITPSYNTRHFWQQNRYICNIYHFVQCFVQNVEHGNVLILQYIFYFIKKNVQHGKVLILQYIFILYQSNYLGLLTDGAPPLPPPTTKICRTYPTTMKLGTVIPYLNQIQKMYESSDTLLEFYWQHFFTGTEISKLFYIK